MAKGSGCPERGRRLRPASNRSRRDAYAADMLNAQRALANNDLGRARMLVDRYIPGQDELEVRGFEWRYLWGRTRGDDDSLSGENRYNVLGLAITPDGKYLASASGWGAGDVQSGTSKDRELVNRMPRPPTVMRLAQSPLRRTIELLRMEREMRR